MPYKRFAYRVERHSKRMEMAKGELEVKPRAWGLGSNGTVNRLKGGSASTHNRTFHPIVPKNPSTKHKVCPAVSGSSLTETIMRIEHS